MFAKQKVVKLKPVKLRPEILTQPNVPKPLHGLNPRTVLRKEWWDKARFAAQEKFNFKCAACGVAKSDAKEHQWLEGHEAWDINYNTGICEVTEIVPLCHYCHNFIHSGRLFSLIVCPFTNQKAVNVLNHGFRILADNNLKAFTKTVTVAGKLGVDTLGVTNYEPPPVTASWSDFKMKLEGKLYDSLYADYDEWRKYYE